MAATVNLGPTVAQIWPFSEFTKVEDKRDGRLSSWKEIAGYLDRGVRTVQRWHADLSLPVHKVGRGPRSPVFGYKKELDRWMRKFAGHGAPRAASPAGEPIAIEELNRSRDLHGRWQESWFSFLLRDVELASTVARTAAATADAARRERVLFQVQRSYDMIRLKATRRHLNEIQLLELSHKLEILRGLLDTNLRRVI